MTLMTKNILFLCLKNSGKSLQGINRQGDSRERVTRPCLYPMITLNSGCRVEMGLWGAGVVTVIEVLLD